MNAILTKAINAYLDLDPESKSRVKKLNGKNIAIEFLPLHFIFTCEFHEDTVLINSNSLLEPDAKISGTPLQMLGVMMAKENRHRFFADDLRIEGNAEFGQQVVELFDHLHIDWEEYLSRLVGDVPAYRASRVINKFSSWLNHTTESFAQNINEYLHEETEWLPAREALQDFFSDIDTLRMDVDRIEAKIKLLMEEKAQ